MSDLSLPPVIPSPQSMRGLAALKILELPQTLQSLSSPLRLSGEVVSRLPDQSIILRTAAGDVRLQNNSAPKLQQGDKMTVELPAGQPPRQANIRPPAPNLPNTPTIPVPNTPPPAAGSRPSMPLPVPIPVPDDVTLIIPPRGTLTPGSMQFRIPIPFGQTLRLTPVATPSLLPAASPATLIVAKALVPMPQPSFRTPSAALPILTPPPVAGTLIADGLPLRTPALTTPLLRLPSVPTTLQSDPDGQPPSLPITSRTTPAPSPFQGTAAQDMKIIATLPPMPQGLGLSEDNFMTNLSLRPGQQLAIVTGMTARQQPVLTFMTPRGQSASQTPYILHYPTQSLPIGSRVIFSLPQAQGLSPDMLATLRPPAFLPDIWPAFSQLLLLAGPALSPLLERQFPRVGTGMQAAQLAGPAGLLLALMRGGTLNESFFLPEDGGFEGTTRQALLKTLQTVLQDIASTQAQNVKDQDGQNWRPIPLPVLTDQTQIDRVMLYVPQYKTDGRQKESTRDGKAVRFVLAARLSHMGDMQLEGLYRTEGKTLDVQVASEHPFSEAARTHIAQIYARALIRSDLSGALFFHLKNNHWRDFSAERATADVVIA